MLALLAGGVSGLITALAFPPADAGPLAFVCLAPLAFVFVRPGLPILAAAAGFSVVFFGMLLSWIRLFGPEAYVGLLVGEAAFVVVALVAGRRAARAVPARWSVLAFPIAFVAGEYVRSRLLFGGFGWGGLGYTQHDNPGLLRLAAYAGVWGVSLIVVLTGLAAERALTHGRRRPRLALAWLATGALVALLPAVLPVPSPRGRSATVALVQGNAPEGTADPHADDRSVLESHLELSRSLAGRPPSLVVWPEGAIDFDPGEDPAVMGALLDSVRAIGAPFLVGTLPDEADDRFRNSSLLLGPDGTTIGRYDKQHLVPFGEYVPFRRLLVPLVDELQQVPRDGVPGDEPTVFTIPQGRFSVAICFESSFPAITRQFVTRGARLFVVSTNDSSFERTAASRQHLAFAQLRAAEHRMWVVQAALTGISSFVAPTGEVTARTELFRPALLTGEVRFATTRTVYGRLGDWLPWACVAMLLVGLVVPRGRPT